MPCYSPIQAYRGPSIGNGKANIVFKRSESTGARLDLPCGQCIGCRLEKSRQWAIRCMHEASLHDDNSFLTLTYDKLPADGGLRLEDFQSFMKRLRVRRKERIRYYHCGEYGDLTGRPHYHALLFNYWPSDAVYWKGSGEGKLFVSEYLNKTWQKGYVVCGSVTFQSAAYVARYVTKKITGAAADEIYNGHRCEYSTMSRRPALGSDWFTKWKHEVFPSDEVVVNGRVMRPPKYYEKELDKIDPEMLRCIKAVREFNTRENMPDRLKARESFAASRLKLKPRTGA